MNIDTSDDTNTSSSGAARRRAIPQYLTVPQAAALAGIQPIGIRAAIRRGTLPAQKFGRDWRISRAALARYCARQARRHADPLPEWVVKDGGE